MGGTRAEIGAELRSRAPEIEQAIHLRLSSIRGADSSDDPEYLASFRSAVAVAVDHGIAVVEASERHPLPPPGLVSHARLTARHGVSLAAATRRLTAGSAVVRRFLHEASRNRQYSSGFPEFDLALDHLLALFSDEYEQERALVRGTSRDRRLERVRLVLDNRSMDTSDWAYDLRAVHVALVVGAPDAGAALRELAVDLDAQLLTVQPDAGTTWAWLGRDRGFDRRAVRRAVDRPWPSQARVAVGEPGQDVSGWRTSHLQARSASCLPERPGLSTTHYEDRCVEAAATLDPILVCHLRNRYLKPLEDSGTSGPQLARTLEAYFQHRGNAAATSGALNISRQAVCQRLRRAEDIIGRPLHDCRGQLELALALRGTPP